MEIIGFVQQTHNVISKTDFDKRLYGFTDTLNRLRNEFVDLEKNFCVEKLVSKANSRLDDKQKEISTLIEKSIKARLIVFSR